MTLALLQQRLAAAPRHLSPFLVLGDPSPALSVDLARAAVGAGASMLELGIAYGDPCADGPAIQRACARSLAAGSTTERAFATVAAIARACPDTPLNLLVYGNLVHARGVAGFCGAAAAAGASSLLVPDVPLGEDRALQSACTRAGLGHVRLVGPRTDDARLRRSADGCVMLYTALVQGVTGVQRRVASAALLARARAATAVPLCAGFGLGSATDVGEAFADGAAVAVVGSHLADVIAAHVDRGSAALVSSFADAVRGLAAAAGQPSTSTSTARRGPGAPSC